MSSTVPPSETSEVPPKPREGDVQPTPRLEVAWDTHPGVARGFNEDAVQIAPPELPPPAARGYLFLVADGMGGHNAGEVASSEAVQRIYAGYYTDSEPDIHRSLDKVIRRTNAELFAQAQTVPAQRGMGTTLTAVAILGSRGYVAHVGDSRLYRVRAGRPEQVTRDHSWVADQVRAGVLTPEQAEVHPQRNVITRALATAADVQVDHTEIDLQVGDVLVLCSDGLNTEVGDNQIAALATKSATAQEAVQRLIKLANDNGGEDNISVVVIRANGEASGVMPAAVTLATVKVPRRSRPLVWVPILVLLGVLIAGAVYAYRQRQQPQAVALTPSSTQAAEPSATLLPVQPGMQAIPSPIVSGVPEVVTTPTLLPSTLPTDAVMPGVTATLAKISTPTRELRAEATGSSTRGPTNTKTARTTPSPPPSRLVAAPYLGDPNNSIESGNSVVFKWTSSGHQLTGGEGYALLVWPVGDSQFAGCRGLDCPTAFDACQELYMETYRPVTPSGAIMGFKGPGEYYWAVVIVDTRQADPLKPGRCKVISEQPDPHRFKYSPAGPPEKPGGEPCPPKGC